MARPDVMKMFARKGWTLEQAAVATGIHPAVCRGLVEGPLNPTARELERIKNPPCQADPEPGKRRVNRAYGQGELGL